MRELQFGVHRYHRSSCCAATTLPVPVRRSVSSELVELPLRLSHEVADQTPWAYSRPDHDREPGRHVGHRLVLSSPKRHRSRSPPSATATLDRPTSGVKVGSPGTPKSTVSTS